METAEKSLVFPSRPKVSSTFKARAINLSTNHFTVSLAPKTPSIFLYDIKILDIESDEQIPADARIQRDSIIRSVAKELRTLFEKNFWYSGQLMWTLKDFKEAKTVQAEFNHKKYAIVFTKTKEINLRPETFRDNTVAAPARQYLNVLIKRYFKEQKYVEWGMNSKFYNPDDINEIPEFYLQIYTGFKTSCEVYQNHTPKILIDFSSRILRTDSAKFYLDQCQSTQQAREMLEGRTVVSSYGNYRMWRIDAVDFSRNPRSATFLENDKKISLADYFKKKYNIQIQDMKQPLLVNIDRRNGKESLLVPELVQMTGLDDDMVKDFKLMGRVAEYTRLDPRARFNKIRSLCAPLGDFFSKNYGITMDQQSSIAGQILPPPKLTLGNGGFIPDKGNFQLKDPVFRPANFDKWLFLYAETCAGDAKYFVETLQKCAGAYAIGVKNPNMVSVKDRSPEALKKALNEKLKSDTQIVVVMYPPAAKKAWYKAIKDACYKEHGVPCQAVVSTTLKKNAMSVCSKILLQMNAKIGKELWITEQPKDLPAKTMIIGADVYHSTKVGQEKKSCIGFCASLNPEFNRFFSKVTLQKREGDEIMTNIGKLVKEAVLKYFAFNGKKFLPEYIIFYRDGVAENQLGSIMKFETQTIIDQLKSIPGYDFKFAEIVVTKRIDDRLFANEAAPGQQRPGGRGGSEPKNFFNPPAGTVVAEKIVSDHFDFLLVSQNVNQGTCTPTHYNVIYDTTGLSQDVFWQLTYNQCYNYYNWNGGVRVPAPVQYAHKLAYLVGQTVQGDPHDNLDQTLYYL